MTGRRLVFRAPGIVAAEAFDPGTPGTGQVRVKTLVSALSAGTESLLWQGLWPKDLPLDDLWAPGIGTADYPVAYGYAAVGRVEALGPGVGGEWLGKRVFSFTAHQNVSVSDVSRLIVLPSDLEPEDAVFLASMETALTLAQDAAPVTGETVGLWGLGTIGILTGALLKGRYRVNLWDRLPFRRDRAAAFGAGTVARPAAGSCDVSLELTGNPAALNEALAATRFSGRLILGSWYGGGTVPVDLGGAFHRSRIQILASQVSTVAPGLSGRWTKERRLAAALDLIGTLRPSALVTHRFPLDRGADAYRQACDTPDTGLQVLFTYD